MRMSLCALGALLTLLVSQAQAQTPAPVTNPDADKEDWIVLFDGKDLKGWTPKIASSKPASQWWTSCGFTKPMVSCRFV